MARGASGLPAIDGRTRIDLEYVDGFTERGAVFFTLNLRNPTAAIGLAVIGSREPWRGGRGIGRAPLRAYDSTAIPGIEPPTEATVMTQVRGWAGAAVVLLGVLAGCTKDPVSGQDFACDPAGPNTCGAGYWCESRAGAPSGGICQAGTPGIPDTPEGADPSGDDDVPGALDAFEAGADGGPEAGDATGGGDAPTDEAGDPGACVPSLSFADAMDDHGAISDPEVPFDVVLAANGERDLKVRYWECGLPVKDVAIGFEILDDPSGVCQLAMATGYTDADGIAGSRVRNVQNVPLAACTVKACVEGAAAVCVTFRVTLDPESVPPLTVGLDYQGINAKIDAVRVFLFKAGSTGKPSCADLAYDALPTASVAMPAVGIHGTAVVPKLPGLATDLAQTYTIVALGSAGSGPTLAWGCNDAEGKVVYGASLHVTVTLKDIPPKLVGTYDVRSRFDLVSGLPPAVAQNVAFVMGFYTNPAGSVLLLMCDAGLLKRGGSTPLKDFCAYLFNDPANPTLDNLSSTGEIVSTIMNSVLVGLLQNQCPYPDNPELCAQIYFTGKDIGDLLKTFQILSTVTCLQEPDASGGTKPGDCRESWHTVVLKWTLGKDCPPDDDQCGALRLFLEAIPGIYGPVLADIVATRSVSADGYTLAIAPHAVDLKYGALVDFALEKALLPQIFGDGNDGLPAVDSLEALIGALVAGKSCLADFSCCKVFAENVAAQTSVPSRTLVDAACDDLVSMGAQYVRSSLIMLDATPRNLTLGTPTDKSCPLADSNQDLKFDQLGTMESPCQWDANLDLGAAAYAPAGSFYGKRK